MPAGRRTSGAPVSPALHRTDMHRVFVVDDHPVMRRGFQFLMEAEPDLEFCGEAASTEEALTLVPDADPDLVLADIALGGLNGLEFVKRLGALRPHIPVLVISLHDESHYADRALRAGARGYVMKDSDDRDILDAIRRILTGGFAFSDAVQQQLFLARQGRTASPASPIDSLSDRELELFHHIGRGLTTAEVARAMHISPKTVETHRTNVREKLGATTTAELVRRAVLWVQEQDAARAPTA